MRISVDDAEGHYHLPIIFTPWTYSTYRGAPRRMTRAACQGKRRPDIPLPRHDPNVRMGYKPRCAMAWRKRLVS
ncbi:MAG: hydroxyisourate hydrolase [Alphaproteobacteria bacterium]